jgi:hypothetical protein
VDKGTAAENWPGSGIKIRRFACVMGQVLSLERVAMPFDLSQAITS